MLQETPQCAFSHPSGGIPNNFGAELNGKRLWKKSGAWEFICNVIGMASEGINLIKITGVHPLCDFVGWGHSACNQQQVEEGMKMNYILVVKINCSIC